MPSLRFARIVVGLAVALGLAVLATHPRLRAWRKQFGVTVLLSAGLPFLVLGALFRTDYVGILSPDVLTDLQPAFEFGLGWIGFAVGMQFDVRKLDKLPKGLDAVVAAVTLVPAALAATTSALTFWLMGLPWFGAQVVRESLVLAACAAPSARVDVEVLAQRGGRAAAETVREVTRIDDVAALLALGLVAVFFRPVGSETRWILPSSAWLLATLGLGGVLGAVAYLLVRRAKSEAEETALLVGTVALSAGASGYLALSVPVVCAIAGSLLANLPMHDVAGLRLTLRDVERPLYLVFLLIVGTLWHPEQWQGWVVAVVFIIARLGGKVVGTAIARRVQGVPLPPLRSMWLSLVPISPISIVAMVAASTFHRGGESPLVHWAVSGVIVASVVTEVAVRIAERVLGRREVLATMEGGLP